MANLRKTIIFGGTGLIGSYLQQGIKLGHQDGDITKLSSVEKVFKKYHPNLVINLAAKINLADCEADPQGAFAINVLGAYHIALVCRKYKARLVYLSTGAVFDGSKTSGFKEANQPHPLNVYGQTKYLAEQITAGLVSNSLVIRTGWVFGGGPAKDNKFYGLAIRKILSGKVLQANYDETGSPVYAKDLAAKVMQLAWSRRRLIHIVNSGRASRYGIAQELAKILHKKAVIKKTHSKDFQNEFIRAKSEFLASKYVHLRPWQQALREYLKEEWRGVKA